MAGLRCEAGSRLPWLCQEVCCVSFCTSPQPAFTHSASAEAPSHPEERGTAEERLDLQSCRM